VFCRDNDSLEKINILNNKKYSVRAIYTPDLALFLNHVKNKNVENKKNYYVITAREWLEKNQQRLYEKQLGIVIQKNWDEKKLKAIFIPMAYNKIEDDDRRVANRISKKLYNKNMFSMTHARSFQEVQHLLQKAQFAICTRMHSAILSFTVETPFITIAYSPKINNFLNDFGLSEWNINIEEFDAKLLSEKIDRLTEKENYDSFIRLIKMHKGRLNKQKQTFQFILQAYMN
jgi:polysaccharide pyruvyl transferase WcaK-like protein